MVSIFFLNDSYKSITNFWRKKHWTLIRLWTEWQQTSHNLTSYGTCLQGQLMRCLFYFGKKKIDCVLYVCIYYTFVYIYICTCIVLANHHWPVYPCFAWAIELIAHPKIKPNSLIFMGIFIKSGILYALKFHELPFLAKSMYTVYTYWSATSLKRCQPLLILSKSLLVVP